MDHTIKWEVLGKTSKHYYKKNAVGTHWLTFTNIKRKVFKTKALASTRKKNYRESMTFTWKNRTRGQRNGATVTDKSVSG